MAAAEAAMGNVNELQRTRARTRAASAATRAAAAAADAAATVSVKPSDQQQCQHVEHWLGAQRFNDGKFEVKTKQTKQKQG